MGTIPSTGLGRSQEDHGGLPSIGTPLCPACHNCWNTRMPWGRMARINCSYPSITESSKLQIEDGQVGCTPAISRIVRSEERRVGKIVSVRVDLGVRRIIKNKKSKSP